MNGWKNGFKAAWFKNVSVCYDEEGKLGDKGLHFLVVDFSIQSIHKIIFKDI